MYKQNVKISALSSGKLDKYEYLTGEDLGYRPDPVQKAKFEYSPLGQVLNKGLDFNEKHEVGLLKRLKNIEDKTDNTLDLIKDQGDRQLDLIDKANIEKTAGVKLENEEDKKLRGLAKYIKNEIKEIIRNNFIHSAYNKTYSFNKYTHLVDFSNRIYDKELPFDEVKKEQEEMLEEINELENRTKPKK